MRRKQVLIVDGYNMIGAWPQLSHLQKHDEIQAARDLLLFELSNYSKYKQVEVVVVFDAQFVPGLTKKYDEYNVTVVFTQEAETADEYIEREVPLFIDIMSDVVVATSDATEQWMIFQRGALRQSAQELLMDINYAKREIEHDVNHHYSSKLRRRSPWRSEQLKKLDQLRQDLEKQD